MADLRHAVITAKMTIVITRRSEMAGSPSRIPYESESWGGLGQIKTDAPPSPPPPLPLNLFLFFLLRSFSLEASVKRGGKVDHPYFPEREEKVRDLTMTFHAEKTSLSFHILLKRNRIILMFRRQLSNLRTLFSFSLAGHFSEHRPSRGKRRRVSFPSPAPGKALAPSRSQDPHPERSNCEMRFFFLEIWEEHAREGKRGEGKRQ